jgi:hypothetical protein
MFFDVFSAGHFMVGELVNCTINIPESLFGRSPISVDSVYLNTNSALLLTPLFFLFPVSPSPLANGPFLSLSPLSGTLYLFLFVIQYCLLKFLLLPSASHSKLTSFNFLTANSSLPLSALLLLDLSVDMRVSMCQCMFACVVNYVCRELLMCYYMYVMWCIYCLCLCIYVCIYV